MVDRQRGTLRQVGYNYLISNKREWNKKYLKVDGTCVGNDEAPTVQRYNKSLINLLVNVCTLVLITVSPLNSGNDKF